ncbi:MAG TPA: MlaD family protein [Candidatus Margulisiibacteriota bacterium]|nr:MlaD family protein [Candidatus Margulisiibacteriota bacterium]
MATEAHKFQVGVFVIATTVVGIAAAIWLGASRFFEKTQPYVTYFSESVQGLDPGSAVKYRGVPGGHVAEIRIAPDGELIEVLMDIDLNTAKQLKRDPSLRATLELSGITGLRYVEIDRRSGDALHQAPVLTFKPPCEVIPSSRSSFKAIQSALGDVYDRVMQLDLAGISAEAKTALQAATQVLRDERIDAVLSNLKSTTQYTSQVTKNLEAMTQGVHLAPAVQNATEATAEAKVLINDLSKGALGRQLGQTIEQYNQLAQAAQQVVGGMQYTLERLDRTASSLQLLSEELRGQPSLLLFAEPPPPRAPEGGTK